MCVCVFVCVHVCVCVQACLPEWTWHGVCVMKRYCPGVPVFLIARSLQCSFRSIRLYYLWILYLSLKTSRFAQHAACLHSCARRGPVPLLPWRWSLCSEKSSVHCPIPFSRKLGLRKVEESWSLRMSCLNVLFTWFIICFLPISWTRL